MSKIIKPKPSAPLALGDAADEKHHKYRCRDLKRQLEELEEYNEILAVKLLRSEKCLRRMKIERNILLERFENSRHYSNYHHDDSESDSDAPLKDTFPHPPASDIDPNEAHHPATVPAASSTLKTGRGRRRGPYNVNPHKTRSSANTPQPMSASSAHDQTGLRKPRMEKDPNAPRRPANAFVLYCQVERPNIRSRGTDLTYGEMTKAMGIKWKNLSQAEKKKYFDLYEREMFRYQQELETYKGGNSSYGGLTAVASSSANPSAVPSSARSEASSVAAALTAVPFADGTDRLSHNGDMDIDADGSIGGDSHMAEYHKDDGSVGSELHTNSAPPSSVVLAAGIEFSSPQLAGSNGHRTLDDDMPSSPIATGDDHNDVGSSAHKSTAVPMGSTVVSHQG